MTPLLLLLWRPLQSGEVARSAQGARNAQAPNVVSGVTVFAADRSIDGLEVVGRRCKTAAHSAASSDSHVLSTYPANGSIVPAGPLLLRATYDQPMSPCSFSVRVEHRENLELVDTPALMSADHRSFLFVLKLAPGSDFQFSFEDLGGAGEPGYMKFRTPSGGYGVPHILSFRSSISRTAPSVADSARLDPAFAEINGMPGKLMTLSKGHWDGPPVPTKH